MFADERKDKNQISAAPEGESQGTRMGRIGAQICKHPFGPPVGIAARPFFQNVSPLICEAVENLQSPTGYVRTSTSMLQTIERELGRAQNPDGFSLVSASIPR